MNSFGRKFILTTFGESHGAAIGGVIDGIPSGVRVDFELLKNELKKRKPGSRYATSRKEDDDIEILSGVFDGFTTGTPVGFIVRNSDQHSKDYDRLQELFRPGHADFGYYSKFGLRDHRGGGRSSARESVARVAAGAFAQMVLNEFDIEILSGVSSIADIKSENWDFEFAKDSEIFFLDRDLENCAKKLILQIKSQNDSLGGSVVTIIKNVLAGLGEVLYDKLDARLASAFMGINGVKAVEIGSGILAAEMHGSQNNDFMSSNGFLSNNAGGIMGGISNSQDIIVKSHFKPTPSIFKPQPTVDLQAQNVICELRGRHDPCIAVRGSVVATAMARIVMVDMLLLNASSRLDSLKKVYS